MVAVILIMSLVLASVSAQKAHSTPDFDYHGCFKIDISCFGQPMSLPNSRITPEACQNACTGFQYAALLNEECRCGNDPKSIQQVDEAMCDHCCMNDPKLGECGNSCPPEHPNIANVYQRQAVLQQYTPAPPPPPVEPSCPPKSTEQPVPEPVSVSEVVSELPAASTPCPLSTPPPYQAPQGSAPAPQTYATAVSSSAQPTTLVAAASTSPCASPEPEISPAYQSSAWAASTQAYGTPYVPSQVPAGSGSVSLVALTATFFAMIILSVMFN